MNGVEQCRLAVGSIYPSTVPAMLHSSFHKWMKI